MSSTRRPTPTGGRRAIGASSSANEDGTYLIAKGGPAQGALEALLVHHESSSVLETLTQRRDAAAGVGAGRAGRDADDAGDLFEGQIGNVVEIQHVTLARREPGDRLPDGQAIGSSGPA